MPNIDFNDYLKRFSREDLAEINRMSSEMLEEIRIDRDGPFSPGEWIITQEGADDFSCGVVRISESQHIEIDTANIVADTRLVAAAPDLWRALKALTTNFKSLADSGDSGNWFAEDDVDYATAMRALDKALGN